MKRVGYITDKDRRRITLLEAMGDYGNVQKAYNKARKCKRHRKDVLIFTKDKEENLDKVREDIINLAYEPSKYHYFKVYEPKERQIMALPFYDRVVQHAINNVLEPIFDKRFISQSYACRKGKGMHAASDTLKEWLYEWNKYHPDQPLYAIKADIHHYFQSIDHAVLKTEIRKVSISCYNNKRKEENMADNTISPVVPNVSGGRNVSTGQKAVTQTAAQSGIDFKSYLGGRTAVQDNSTTFLKRRNSYTLNKNNTKEISIKTASKNSPTESEVKKITDDKSPSRRL